MDHVAAAVQLQGADCQDFQRDRCADDVVSVWHRRAVQLQRGGVYSLCVVFLSVVKVEERIVAWSFVTGFEVPRAHVPPS